MTQKRNYKEAYLNTKTALFEACYKAGKAYGSLFTDESFDNTTYAEKIRRLSALSALTAVIVEAGLADHYLAWKEANK